MVLLFVFITIIYFPCKNLKSQMDREIDRNIGFRGLCKCCLQYGCFKNLWAEYHCFKELEIYGEMLAECFNLSFGAPVDANYEEELICNDCISRLRDAFNFKKQVLMAAKQIADKYKNCAKSIASDTEIDTEDYSILFVKADSEQSEGNTELVDDIEETHDDEFECQQHEQNNYHMLSTINNLQKNSKDVAMSNSIPVQTSQEHEINGSIVKENCNTVLQLHNEQKFNEELKILLTNTNITPFKSNASKLFCAYCDSHISDASLIGEHTRSQHAGEMKTNILQVTSMNEIVKVDIQNLECILCSTALSWSDLSQHLTEAHKINLAHVNRIIPYNLQNQSTCVLCEETFSDFQLLDCHMNVHYKNYICPVCGGTFISNSRFQKHIAVHKTGEYICHHCDLVFALEIFLKNHIQSVHERSKPMKCKFCNEKFKSSYQRHSHMLKNHAKEVKNIECRWCDASFHWKPYYYGHMRKAHSSEMKFQCRYCDAKFFTLRELKNHFFRHTGEKNFVCNVCGQRFAVNTQLVKHFRNEHASEPKT